ncbi:MAG: hypothetical protein ABSF53_07765, partial [Terracidiphilus sp.]
TAYDEPPDRLTIRAKFTFDPPHVSEDLTDNLIGRFVSFEFNYDKGIRSLFMRQNVNPSDVCIELLANGPFNIHVYRQRFLEYPFEVSHDEVLKVCLKGKTVGALNFSPRLGV